MGSAHAVAGFLAVGGTHIAVANSAGGSLCITPGSLPPNTRLTENPDGSVTAVISGIEVRLGRDAAGNFTILAELGGSSSGGEVRLVGVSSTGSAATIRAEELPASMRIVANSDGTFSLREVNQPSAPAVQLVKNSDGSFTVLQPSPLHPPAAAAAMLLSQQLTVKPDGTATVTAPPPGFELVRGPGGVTFLHNTRDGTRVPVTQNKDGSLGLTAAGLTQVMVASVTNSSQCGPLAAGTGGGGLLEAAVYNHLYNGGVLPPGVSVEANSDGTISVTVSGGSSPPLVSILNFRGARDGIINGGVAALSSAELLGLERLLAANGGAEEGAGGISSSQQQLPPGISLVRLSDGSQAVMKNGVATGTILGRQPNGQLSLQAAPTSLRTAASVGAMLSSGWLPQLLLTAVFIPAAAAVRSLHVPAWLNRRVAGLFSL